jgi:hypothetical protein
VVAERDQAEAGGLPLLGELGGGVGAVAQDRVGVQVDAHRALSDSSVTRGEGCQRGQDVGSPLVVGAIYWRCQRYASAYGLRRLRGRRDTEDEAGT